MVVVWLGAAAGLACGLLEGLWLIASALLYFDGPGEGLRMLLVLASLGGAAGLCLGGVEAAVWRLLPAQRRRLWLTALMAPGVAWVCAHIFAGPQAQKVPHHDLLAVAIGLGVLTLGHWGLKWLPRVPPWLAAAATVALYAVDQKVLPRLYPFFHQALAVLVFGGAQVALVRARPPRRWALLLVLPGAAALSLWHLGHERGLRTLVLERAVVVGPLARLSPAPAKKPLLAADPLAAPSVPPGPRLGDLDVFLVTIDAMRADRLEPRTAPNLTRLAERGVRFSHAYAQVPHTSFSVATLLTGKHVYSLSALGLEAEQHQTLAEVLKRERYKTAAFYPPSVFYIDHERLKGLEASAYGFEYVKYEYLDAPRRTQQVIDFFAAEQPRRAFVWVHYLEPHHPYDPHPGHDFGAGAAAAYDGEVHFVDAEVQKLVEWVQQNRPRALIVVASDHGEELGEHGGHYHGTTLYDEQVRVPLFFTTLDGSLRPRTIAAPVGLVDVAPTLLPLLGIASSARMRGRDLGPFLAGAPEKLLGPVYAEIDRQKAIIDGSDKLVCDLATDACRLFDLAGDPAEQHNLIDRERDRADRLRARLEAWMREETRFEHAELEGADAPTRKSLERGRLGQASALPELARLLDSPEKAVRAEAARLILRLPPDPSVPLHGDDPWVLVARARLGEKVPLPECSGELCVHVALVRGDAGELSRALDAVGDDRELEIQLLVALGRTHDPRALDALVVHLGAVRTRVETVSALQALGDARAVPFLARWIGADPYIPVRAAMARALGALAREADDRRLAAEALERLLAAEAEPEVREAARAALTSLNRPATSDTGRGRP
jgi:arylsulfatase A-like enzyme